jgi:hypothetical protein
MTALNKRVILKTGKTTQDGVDLILAREVVKGSGY